MHGRQVVATRGGGLLSGLFRSHISLTASRQFGATSSLLFLVGRLRYANGEVITSRAVGWESHGPNPILTTADISCSRIVHIPGLVKLGWEFSGCMVSTIFVRDFSRLTAGTWLCSLCFLSSPPDVRGASLRFASLFCKFADA